MMMMGRVPFVPSLLDVSQSHCCLVFLLLFLFVGLAIFVFALSVCVCVRVLLRSRRSIGNNKN